MAGEWFTVILEEVWKAWGLRDMVESIAVQCLLLLFLLLLLLLFLWAKNVVIEEM
jgi:hypothetical protein